MIMEGDSVHSYCLEHWESVYNLPENAEFRALSPDPRCPRLGTVLHCPRDVVLNRKSFIYKKVCNVDILLKVGGCGNKCVYCNQSFIANAYSKRKNGDITNMSFETFKELLDKLPQSVTILFSGLVDCWMHENCYDMLKECHDKKRFVSIFHTMTYITERDIELLGSMNLVAHLIHLPSDRDYMKKFIDDDFIKRTMKLREICPEAIFMCVGRIVPRLKFLKVKEEVPKNIDSSGPQYGVYKYLTGPIQCAPCSVNGERMYHAIWPNGDVTLCIHDREGRHILGNIFKEDFYDICNGPVYKQILDDLQSYSKDALCRSCHRAVSLQDHVVNHRQPRELVKLPLLEENQYYQIT